VKALDEMLGGGGYFRGTSILVTGTAGTGKSSLAAAFALAACDRGERCVYFAFEESMGQLIRNMRSVGMQLEPWVDKGTLKIQAGLPASRGLEEHLVYINAAIERLNPMCVVLDPITNFGSTSTTEEIRTMFFRLLDNIKGRGITVLITALMSGSERSDETQAGVSSTVDAWITLDNPLVGHTRRGELYIIKAREMGHSRETRELVLSTDGITLRDLPHEEKEHHGTR
jgi:circadian clock protein KaiC